MKMIPKHHIAGILAVVFALMMAWGYGWPWSMRSAPMASGPGFTLENNMPKASFGAGFARTPTAETYLPDITFFGPGGKKLQLADFKDKYLLINFWATWCAPCIAEMPAMEQLRDKFKSKGMEVVAVSIDQNKDEQILKNFLASHGISDFALYYEKERGVQDRITMPGIPLTFLLAPGGRILYVFQGQGDWISVEAIDFFSDILKNG